MSKQNSTLETAERLTKKTRHMLMLFVAPLIFSGGSVAAQEDRNGADREHRRPSITVSGEGEVQSKPDIVAINLGVITESDQGQQALAANSEAMQKLFNVLDGQQIAEKDRQTTRFDVSPQYRQEQPEPRGPRGPQGLQAETPKEPRIVGYQVTNEVRVKVRDVSRLGAVLDAVVSAGSNRIHGIEFSVEDEEKLMDEARGNAIRRAREKAELLAEAAGVSVGSVITIREEESARPMPQQRMMMMEARSVPIAEGEQTITARVYVTFQLDVESD